MSFDPQRMLFNYSMSCSYGDNLCWRGKSLVAFQMVRMQMRVAGSCVQILQAYRQCVLSCG